MSNYNHIQNSWATTDVSFVGNRTTTTYLVNKSPITNIYLSPFKDGAGGPRQSVATTSQDEDTGIGSGGAKVVIVIG